MSIDSDLDFMLSDWGSSTIALGEYAGRGIVDVMDTMDFDKGGEPVLVRRTIVRLKRSDFIDDDGVLTIARGDICTIDGKDYSVTDLRAGGGDGPDQGIEIDGRELHIAVRKV